MSNAFLIDIRSVPLVITNPSLGNVTATTFTEPHPMLTAPSGDGVITLGHGGQETAEWVELMFYGTGNDDTQFNANIYGWDVQKAVGANHHDLWIPHLLCSADSITIDSTQFGIAGTDIPAANFFATGITLNYGDSPTSVEVISPGYASHEIAHMTVATKGARMLEVRFAMGSSSTTSAASGNCLCKRL